MQGLNVNYAPQISLLGDIDEQLSDAWGSVYKLQTLSEYIDPQSDTNEDYDEEETYFLSKIERLHLSISLLIESLGYTQLLQEYKLGYSKHSTKSASFSITRDGDYHSDTLAFFWRYHKSVSALINSNSVDTDERKQRTLLAAILRNTSKIVHDHQVSPTSEAEVRNCVYKLLTHVFPDTLREVPVPQVTKTYKADLGIPSLKAAIEYKYATTEEEAKKVIGGFYEDMRGYAGSEDWKHFFAVVYMSKPFFTIEQIRAEFARVGVDSSWSPILVHGEGTRKK
ncbi:hypothetical protein HU735_10525 [Pseudomonas sp. BW16M2]|uniref:PD-(D/E)XK nuclease domain-containing protein n=1 Tax=Pseudomonas sp. BW16M2 TaxID=2745489 RepID=UPI0016459005|nr:hypothetical protein [Pseudomonas sp. BW16M2]MBC3435847.1 hypothetical protein [Pseudomonas sp. BW16M2]